MTKVSVLFRFKYLESKQPPTLGCPAPLYLRQLPLGAKREGGAASTKRPLYV